MTLTTHLLSPRAIAAPHDVYRELREHAPVTWLPEHRAWFVATHAGVAAAFRDQRLASDRLTPLEARLDPPAQAALADTFELLRGWMVFHDPPHHERLRAPVHRAFTPRTVEALRPRVEAIVDRCLDDMEADLAAAGTTDVIARLAFPLPAIVIAELLGVPPEDRDEFKTWSAQLATIVFGAGDHPRRAADAAAGTARFAAYFGDLVERRRHAPGDDLISLLVAARDAADPPLGDTELVGACTLLLFGGHETTTNLIGNAVLTLLEHPDELRWLRAHPGAVATAVEELHRFDGSSKVMVRVVGEPHDREGAQLAAGDTVFLGIAAANRDPEVFDDPDALRLDRPDAHRHLGFGAGIHHCLGAPLARLETQVALTRLLGRFGALQLAVDPGELRWGATILGRGLDRLPIAATVSE